MTNQSAVRLGCRGKENIQTFMAKHQTFNQPSIHQPDYLESTFPNNPATSKHGHEPPSGNDTSTQTAVDDGNLHFVRGRHLADGSTTSYWRSPLVLNDGPWLLEHLPFQAVTLHHSTNPRM